jgi:hypothetical protein
LKRPIEILAMRLAVGPNLPLKGAGSRPERAGDIDRGDIRPGLAPFAAAKSDQATGRD